MSWILAALGGLSVFMVAVPKARMTMAGSLERYLVTPSDPPLPRRRLLAIPAGGMMAAAGGAFIGLLAAQGDLFLAGRSRSAIAFAALGAMAGWVMWSMRQTNNKQRRSRALRFELPLVADAISLHVVAGASVVESIRSVVDETNGVTSQELLHVLDDVDGGTGLPEALVAAAQQSAHPDAGRLYETLGHAHRTGGRLGSALTDLAVDYRAAIERDITAESGRRALASYGPVLVLMVPTALFFLIYPTLLGLRSLAGTP